MNIDLKGKTALITGSSEGIGLEIAKKLYEHGCKIAINGRNEKRLNKIKKTLKQAIVLKGDVTKEQDAKKIIKKFIKVYKNIDILVCNVGSGKSSKKRIDLMEWRRFFEINFWSTLNILNYANKYLIKSNSSVICISSICGIEHVPNAPIPYSVAKSALNSYIKNQSKIFGKFNVRLNAIAPGNINFKGSVWQKKMSKFPFKTKKYIKENVPLNNLGDPSDVSNLVIYLASKYAKFISGSIFVVDGGQLRNI